MDINTTENDLTIGDTINIDATVESNSKTNAQNLWKDFDLNKYQVYVTISSNDSTNESQETDDKIVYIKDLEKRKEVYGICGECNEPGAGFKWCQPCNAKRLKENFKNWTSGNKDIDELIQQSQLDAVCSAKCLEWIPFEKFQDVAYIARGGFGKIYSANWPEGPICWWDIENQEWVESSGCEKVVLKSLDNSSDISTDFLNEVKSYHQFYFENIIPCFGITQDPTTKDYMMVLYYCKNGDLINYLNHVDVNYKLKINNLLKIARGLSDIHNAGKVHKDLHSGNILFNHDNISLISDLGMCQPVNNEEQSDKKEGNYGVLPYMAPEILRGHQYTQAADIYSFGIIMNEFFSEETPYNNISHDHILAVKICKGLRPKISEDTPKLLVDLIMKCWNAKAENRPTAKELFQILKKWVGKIGEIKLFRNSDDSDNDNELFDKNSEICSQIKECEEIRKCKLNNSTKNKPKNTQTHPQAIYTSRLLSFKNLPEPVNSSNMSLFQYDNPENLAGPISECLDCKINI